MQQVKTTDQLKEMIASGVHDFFIRFNCGARSSKYIDHNTKTGLFYVMNEIDGSEQELTESQLMNECYTNIGKAITIGAFYSYTP